MTAPSTPGGAGPAGTADPRRWKALAVCLITGFMTLLDVSIVNVALPSIRDGLQADQSDLQWVLSGYALTFGLILVPAGRFGDTHGQRNVFIAGVALFTAASAAAGMAPNPAFLIAARLVQGLAGGIINPQVSGLIQRLFQGAERGRAFGALGATIGVSTAVGPLLGGLLIHLGGTEHGWRWIFYVNLPVGIAAIALAWHLIPEHCARGSGRRQTLDPLGVVLLGSALVLILLPLVQERQWQGQRIWPLALLGVAVLVAFLAWERRYARTGAPLVDLTLFYRRSYGLGCLIALLYFAGFTSIFFIFTLYLQNGLGYSPLAAGAAITPFALGSAVSSALGGRRVTRYGRPLVVVGLVMVGLGLGATALVVDLVSPDHVTWATVLPLLLAGTGSGLVISPNQTLTLSEVPLQRAGSAGGVLQTGQRIGAALGIAVVGTAFFTALGVSNQWARAFDTALLVAIGFVLVALCAALTDVIAGRRTRSSIDD